MRPPDTDTFSEFARIRGCTLCPHLGRPPALGAPPQTRCPVMLVGEAPGRLGAGRTGRPFVGDEAGRRLDGFLERAGLAREEVFVTNAVLCLPLDARGRNRRPTATELRACSQHLQRQIEVLDPALVVAMGTTALAGLALVAPHGRTLRDGTGAAPWSGRRLAVVHHPGRRSTLHRRLSDQEADWRALGEVVSALPGSPSRA